MARKNLLTGLTNRELPAGNSEQESHQSATAIANFGGARGAIGAVTRSIEQLKANSVHDLATDLVEASFVTDRLEFAAESQAELVNSMRDHGQQVPILVRPHPTLEGRYQIAYGHRRLKAAAEIGCTVRAIIKKMTDDELVMAQGQENSARTDLSFIEKARFAARLEQKGFGRETIMAALCVDKTGLSRLISAAVKIPQNVLEAIGAAPKTGRDRWVELAVRLERDGATEQANAIVASDQFSSKSSDERFNIIFDAALVAKPKAQSEKKTPPTVVWEAPDGKKVARIQDDKRQFAVLIDKKAAPDFGAYLVEALPELYAAFLRRVDE